MWQKINIQNIPALSKVMQSDRAHTHTLSVLHFENFAQNIRFLLQFCLCRVECERLRTSLSHEAIVHLWKTLKIGNMAERREFNDFQQAAAARRRHAVAVARMHASPVPRLCHSILYVYACLRTALYSIYCHFAATTEKVSQPYAPQRTKMAVCVCVCVAYKEYPSVRGICDERVPSSWSLWVFFMAFPLESNDCE